MDWSQIYLDTFIPELPKFWNGNFSSFKRYLDVFYDENREIIIKPLETAGRVKGARGEFVTCVVDNLVVRNQFTNLYDNITLADSDYLELWVGLDSSLRDAKDSSLWPYEDPAYKWIDVDQAYYKITNEYQVAFQYNNISQVIGVQFDPSLVGGGPFQILLDPCVGTEYFLDASLAGSYMEFILESYDPSWGPTWTVYKPIVAEPPSVTGLIKGSGTTGYIPIFSSLDELSDSPLSMTGGDLFINSDVNISGTVVIDSSLKTKNITIENGIYDTSGNLILGYGSPIQIGDPNDSRGIRIYGSGTDPVFVVDNSTNSVSISSLDVSGLTISGQTLDPSSFISSYGEIYVKYPFNVIDISAGGKISSDAQLFDSSDPSLFNNIFLWNKNGNNINCTPDASNAKISFLYPGKYKLNISSTALVLTNGVDFPTGDIEFAVFKNSIIQENLCFYSEQFFGASPKTPHLCNISGILDISQGDEIDLRFRFIANNNPIDPSAGILFLNGNLTVMKLS